MTKRELYDALRAAGVKLPDYRRITQLALEEQYARLQATAAASNEQAQPVIVQQQPCAAEQQSTPANPPALFFEHAGWCEELGTSYYMGWYQPTCWREYNALKPFAKRGAAL